MCSIASRPSSTHLAISLSLKHLPSTLSSLKIYPLSILSEQSKPSAALNFKTGLKMEKYLDAFEASLFRLCFPRRRSHVHTDRLHTVASSPTALQKLLMASQVSAMTINYHEQQEICVSSHQNTLPHILRPVRRNSVTHQSFSYHSTSSSRC